MVACEAPVGPDTTRVPQGATIIPLDMTFVPNALAHLVPALLRFALLRPVLDPAAPDVFKPFNPRIARLIHQDFCRLIPERPNEAEERRLGWVPRLRIPLLEDRGLCGVKHDAGRACVLACLRRGAGVWREYDVIAGSGYCRPFRRRVSYQ